MPVPLSQVLGRKHFCSGNTFVSPALLRFAHHSFPVQDLLSLAFAQRDHAMDIVGRTEGVHDDGRGETADLLTVVAHANLMHPGVPLWLSGFSFGAAVTLAASEQVRCEEMIMVAPGFSRMAHWQNVKSGGAAPDSTLLLHGEKDDTVPLADSINWARPRDIAVVVVPEADHFFHQRLHILKRIIGRWMLQHTSTRTA